MKILSNTDKGGRVVEFSEREFRELYVLAKSCNPDVTDLQDAVWQLQMIQDDRKYYDINEFDFSEVFANVRAFREMQFNINKIKNLVDGIEKSIKK